MDFIEVFTEIATEIAMAFAEIGQAVCWPLTILVLAVTVLRDPLIELFKRIRQIKAGGAEVNLSEDVFDGKLGTSELPSSGLEQSFSEAGVDTSEAADYEKPANWFWFAADVRFAQLALISGQSGGIITRNLSQALHHIRELDIDSPFVDRLTRLAEDAGKSLESDWTEEQRLEYFHEINRMIGEADWIARKKQPCFRASPDDPPCP